VSTADAMRVLEEQDRHLVEKGLRETEELLRSEGISEPLIAKALAEVRERAEAQRPQRVAAMAAMLERIGYGPPDVVH
jgi:hypothetical protein